MRARYKVQFTASAAFRDKIERLQELMRTAVPDGDLAAILEDVVTEKLGAPRSEAVHPRRGAPSRLRS